MSTPGAHGYPLGAVTYDMDSSGTTGSPMDYSKVGQQDMALKVPLGSQLSLLNAMNAGNPYVNYAATGFQNLGSLENVLQGYNTMGQTNTAGQYFNFSQAYGRF